MVVFKKKGRIFYSSFKTLDQQMIFFFIHRVHVNLEREAYREKEGKRFSEFTWNLWTKNFHLLIKCNKTWMKKYDPFFETLPSCIFWININSFEIIAIFHRTVGDEPGILFWSPLCVSYQHTLKPITIWDPLATLYACLFWINIHFFNNRHFLTANVWQSAHTHYKH